MFAEPVSVADGWRLVEESVVAIPHVPLSLLEVTGADRVRFLQSFATNDIAALVNATTSATPGAEVASAVSARGCETFFCNVKGRIVGHGFVFVDAERCWFVGTPGQAEGLTAHLLKYRIRERVEVASRADDFVATLLIGPAAPALADRRFPAGDATQHASFLNARETATGERVFHLPIWGAMGRLVLVPRDSAGEFARWLGTERVMSGPLELLEPLRVLASFPAYGTDLSDEMLAQEGSRTASAISFKKGCYLGQEPIARLDAMGHTNRELRAWEELRPVAIEEAQTAARSRPVQGELLIFENGTPNAGRVTSSVVGPDGSARGLALLRTAAQAPGTVLRSAPGTLLTVIASQSTSP